jgi:2-polyprenyl-6-methoxyphenol hydroxylase-like FAD-dependent oxidoreductase
MNPTTNTEAGAVADVAATKFVAAGTVIMRRSDVMGLLHKRIAQAHEEADDIGENGSLAAFSAVRHKIAAYMAVLSDLRELPEFTNATVAHLASQGATASDREPVDQEGSNQ